MKIRKKNINFRFKKSKLKSKNEKSIMQRSLFSSKNLNPAGLFKREEKEYGVKAPTKTARN